MTEPMLDGATPQPWGLLAEFADPDALIDATRRARAEGFGGVEPYSPFPIHGLVEATGFHEVKIARACLIGAVIGAVAGWGLQVAVNPDYPLNVGGRPVLAHQSFVLTAFELMVLGAVLATVGSMLALNGLPRLHHPLFEVEAFSMVSADGFFLALECRDGAPDLAAMRRFLAGLQPRAVHEVIPAELPA